MDWRPIISVVTLVLALRLRWLLGKHLLGERLLVEHLLGERLLGERLLLLTLLMLLGQLAGVLLLLRSSMGQPVVVVEW
jgi:hypothetical protein